MVEESPETQLLGGGEEDAAADSPGLIDDTGGDVVGGSSPSKPPQAPQKVVEPGIAELELKAMLRGKDSIDHAEAFQLTLTACDVAKRGPAGTGRAAKRIDWRSLACGSTATAGVILLMVYFLCLTRYSVRIMNARDGMLIATGLQALPDEEPVVATGLALKTVNLINLIGLPMETVRNVRDVTLVHDGVWRCLRVSRVTRLGTLQLLLETPDDIVVRLSGGSAWLRLGPVEDENEIELDGATYVDAWTGSSEVVKPTATLYQISSIAMETLSFSFA